MDALFYAVDGNFHATLKHKRSDEDDTPLSMGAGYFANEEAFAAYKETLGPLGPEVSDSYSTMRRCARLTSIDRRVHVTNSRLWGWACTGVKSRVRWGCFVRGTCSFCQEDTSIWRRAKGGQRRIVWLSYMADVAIDLRTWTWR